MGARIDELNLILAQHQHDQSCWQFKRIDMENKMQAMEAHIAQLQQYASDAKDQARQMKQEQSHQGALEDELQELRAQVQHWQQQSEQSKQASYAAREEAEAAKGEVARKDSALQAARTELEALKLSQPVPLQERILLTPLKPATLPASMTSLRGSTGSLSHTSLPGRSRSPLSRTPLSQSSTIDTVTYPSPASPASPASPLSLKANSLRMPPGIKPRVIVSSQGIVSAPTVSLPQRGRVSSAQNSPSPS